MKKLLFPALVLITALSLTASGLLAQAKGPAKPPLKPVPTDGLLYKISGKGLKKPSYIFGTIHVICPNDMFSMEKLTGFMDQTEQLIMEIDMDDPNEMQSFGSGILIPGGKAFTGLLTPEEYAKIDALTKSTLGVPVENVKNIKPVIVGMLVIATPKTMGCQALSSYELSFMQAAAAKKKPIVGLETVAFQSEVVGKMPLEQQVKRLYKIALDPQRSVDSLKKLLEIYKTQDANKLYNELERQSAESDEGKEFARDLIDDRNKSWIPKIEKIIKEKPSFIAVGGGHLGGKAGVIKLLKAKGYIVQPVKL